MNICFRLFTSTTNFFRLNYILAGFKCDFEKFLLNKGREIPDQLDFKIQILSQTKFTFQITVNTTCFAKNRETKFTQPLSAVFGSLAQLKNFDTLFPLIPSIPLDSEEEEGVLPPSNVGISPIKRCKSNSTAAVPPGVDLSCFEELTIPQRKLIAKSHMFPPPSNGTHWMYTFKCDLIPKMVFCKLFGLSNAQVDALKKTVAVSDYSMPTHGLSGRASNSAKIEATELCRNFLTDYLSNYLFLPNMRTRFFGHHPTLSRIYIPNTSILFLTLYLQLMTQVLHLPMGNNPLKMTLLMNK